MAEKVDATVVNMRFVKPIDEEMILQLAESHDQLITIEENVVPGGAGSAVNETLARHSVHVRIANYGLPDRLIQHGSRDDMLRDAGMTAEAFGDFVAGLQRGLEPAAARSA
ncbi:MAG: transketolase C-terminal domain-containing protein [Gammaproteobacteria bacterium]